MVRQALIEWKREPSFVWDLLELFVPFGLLASSVLMVLQAIFLVLASILQECYSVLRCFG